jgi:hypothetical protein
MACKFGIDLDNCRAANDHLIRIGYPSKLNCRSCKLDDASRFAARQYGATIDRDRRRVTRWVKRMGFDATGFETGASLHTGFRCPVIHETIHRPCSLEHCAHHIDYPWAANCLLAYAHQQNVESLSTEEIAYLYQMPIVYVKNLLSEAMIALRSGTIDQKATEGGKFEPQFSYFITDRVCCVCESALEEEIPRSLRIETLGAVYCSRECRDEKHPLLITLEVQKGLPVAQILEWTFKRFRSLALAEQSLGLPRWLTHESSKKYLDRPLDFYFPSLRAAQNRNTILVRKTWRAPEPLYRMMAKLRPVRRAIAERFGPRNVSLSTLQRDLNRLVQHL